MAQKEKGGDTNDSMFVEPENESDFTFQENLQRGIDRAGDIADEIIETESRELSIRYRESDDPGERQMVVKAFEGHNDQKAVETLLLALNDDNDKVRDEASRILMNTRIEEDCVPLLIASLGSEEYVRKHAYKLLLELDVSDESIDNIVDQLVQVMYRTKNTETKRYAVSAMMRLGGERTVEPLINFLKEGDRVERELAWKSLVKIGIEDPEHVESVGQVLEEHGDTEVREGAARVLGGSEYKDAADHLISALENEDETDVREAAAEALGDLGGERAREYLETLVDDVTENNRVRLAARKSMDKLRTE